MEQLLVYKLEDKEYFPIVEKICKQLNIKIKIISDSDVNFSIGYLVGIDGYTKVRIDDLKIDNQEMIVFAEFSDEQLEIILQLFRNAQIPFIPLKAVLTATNVEWSFAKLHDNVEEEYKLMHSLNQGE